MDQMPTELLRELVFQYLRQREGQPDGGPEFYRCLATVVNIARKKHREYLGVCLRIRPVPILFGTIFAHGDESVLIRVIMAEDRVQLFRQQVRWWLSGD